MSLYGYKRKTKPAPWVTAGMSGEKQVKAFKAFKDHIVSKRQYGIEARAFVEAAIARGETCPVVAAIPELRNGRKYGYQISAQLNEVHHQRGRGRGGRGSLLTDKRFWIAMSKQGHRWVHANIEKARQYGWMPSNGEWNVPILECAVVTRNEFSGIKNIEIPLALMAG